MSSAGVCAFCRQRHANARTGQMLRTADGEITAHYNCTLFSPKVVSAKSDSEDDFGGFDIETVKKEIKRANKLKCSHCNKNGASVGCDIGRCKKSYHYECVEDADGKCIENSKKQIYIAFCAEHKEQAKAANNSQLDEDSDTSEQSGTPEEFHRETGQKTIKKTIKKYKERKYGKTNSGRITKQTKQMGRIRSYNVKRHKKLINRHFKLTEKKMKTEYSAGVMQDVKRRKQSDTVLANYSAVTQMTDDEEVPGTSASARQRVLRSDSDSDDSDLPVFDGCNISQSQKTPEKRCDESITSQSSQQIKEGLHQSPYRCPSRSSSESSESLLSPKRFETYVLSGLPEKDRKQISERSTDLQKEDMEEDDKMTGNTVVTDEAPSFDPLLEMSPEEQPATNVPVDTVISSPSRTSPVIKQCLEEQTVGCSVKETIAFRNIREKQEKIKILSRLRRRLITRPPNTTNTNGRSHMSSLDGSTSADHYLDGPAVQSIDYCDGNESTAQPIISISGKDRPATQPIDSSYSENTYVAQLVGSFDGEDIPVIKPENFFNKSSHTEPMGYINYNSSTDEKAGVYPNVFTPFAVQLIRQLTLLNEQSTKISNTQVISERYPSASPLAQDVYGGTSGTSLSVSPLAQYGHVGISGTYASVSPVAQYGLLGTSGTCPSVSPLAQDVCGATSETYPSVSLLAKDVGGGTSGTCPSFTPLAQDVYSGTSETYPSVSPLAQDVYGDTSGTGPLVTSLAQDVHVGTSRTCPSVSPLAQNIYGVASGTCLLVSPIAQDVHVEQPTTSLNGIDDTSLEDLPQAFTCPDVSAPETDKEARLSYFLSPETISDMSAKLVTGALAKKFNFSNIAMQIKSPLRSAKSALSHSKDDQVTSENSPRPGPSSEATQKYLNEVDEKQSSSGLKQCDNHCPCYSRLEHKVDSLLQGQVRLMALLEEQHRKVNLLIETVTTTPDSVERSFPSPPLSTSSFPGTQPLDDHNYSSMQPPT
ncbi:uncharacterized protein LOC135006096 isoform X2 [Pseudophryne corroboree]|uniref:uncharacterized protein LOC135006096 isoform X2 n=1 Tax=Pseudophryne corroboree TaxID=495146 RepID=UPI003081815A